MSLLNSISNKIFGEKADNGTDNDERARIVEILEKGSKDEIEALGDTLRLDVFKKPTNLGLHLFARVFYWKPFTLRVRYEMIKTTEICSMFLEKIKHLNETISKESSRLLEITQTLGYDKEINEEMSFLIQRETYLIDFQMLFNSKDDYSEAFWKIVEMEYGEDNTKDFREQCLGAIDNLVNICIFDENGFFRENLTFAYIGNMIAYYELMSRFDKEIAIKYIQVLTEKLRS